MIDGKTNLFDRGLVWGGNTGGFCVRTVRPNVIMSSCIRRVNDAIIYTTDAGRHVLVVLCFRL